MGRVASIAESRQPMPPCVVRRLALVAVLALCALSGGCWFGGKKTKKNQVQTPPLPAPTQTVPTPTPAPTKQEPAPVVHTPVQTPPPETKKPETLPTPRPQPTTPTPAQPRPKPPRKAAPAPKPQAPASVPQLGVLLTPEQRRQFEQDYASSLARADKGLVDLTAFRLSAEQSETVTRIRSFVRQARDLHNRDLATAAQLARRADLLAQDLLRALR